MSKITHNIWVGGENNPRFIVDKGFDAVVDLRAKDDSEYHLYLQKSGIKYVRRPVPDGSGLPLKDLLDTVEWIIVKQRRGAKILIHCGLGRGRAALVTASYLVRSGLDPETALEVLKRRRQITYLNSQQKATLQAFAGTLLRAENQQV
jgi:protein-tyrosine phosphatase